MLLLAIRLRQTPAMESKLSRARFQTTRWSVVLRTRAPGRESERALEEVCRTSWLPLYAYARRWGRNPQDSEDLVQGFFVNALNRGLFASADPAEGRLRNLLLTAFKRHLLDAAAHDTAARRHPGSDLVRIDFEATERRLRESAGETGSPEMLFDREWAHSVLAQALERLRERYRSEGKDGLFEALRPWLSLEEDPGSLAALAESLSMTASALGVALHRLRKRYREALRETIAETVESDTEIDSEFQHLSRILSSP